MKQSVIVISALFAAVEANANVADAKARMERDIRGYLHEGLEFDFKNIKSATKMIKRDQKAKNKWNNEVRQNIEETHVVLDEFKSALEYEKSQIVQTEVPSANNFNWGKIEINNNQQIVDNYMETAAHGKDLSHEWAKDATAYGNAIHKSHAKMGKDVMANWKDNGVKATNFAKSGIQNAQEAWRQADVNAPHSLAINTTKVAQDASNLLEAVGEYDTIARNSARAAAKATKPYDEAMERAQLNYIHQKEQVAKGYNKAIQYEIENTHLDRGLPGGEGSLSFTHKQKIANHWTKPMEHAWRADAEFQRQMAVYHNETTIARMAVYKQASQKMPPIFNKMETSWNALANDFKNAPTPKSLASRAEINTDLTGILDAELELVKTITNDSLDYVNSTQVQRNALKSEVQTYMEQEEAITQKFNDAMNYEAANITFSKNAAGQLQFVVNNETTIVDKYSDAMTDNMVANQGLAGDFIDYERSIAAQKAAFQATADATWPQKAQALQKAMQQFQQTMQAPQSLITDKQEVYANTVNDSIYADINQRLAFNWEVKNDLKAYIENTADARSKLKAEAQQWNAAGKQVRDMYSAAWNMQIAETKFTPATATAPASIKLDNSSKVTGAYRVAAQADQNLGNDIIGDIMNYTQAIQGDQAAFKNTVQTKWVPAINNIHKSDNAIANEIMNFPTGAQALITDKQQVYAEDINNEIYADVNQRLAFNWEVKNEIQAYMEETADARSKLEAQAQGWQADSQKVSDMYSNAWNMQVENTHVTPSNSTAPASIQLDNANQVFGAYRNATQADQNLGNEIIGEVMNYSQAVQKDQAAFRNTVQTKWVPAINNIHKADVAIVDEIMNFPMGAQALMSVESGNNLSLNQQLAYGSVFLMAMIAVAALSNKGKAASKTIEFDVEDLEMTNKKESKKQIKKTLKDIMKTSNTKVTLMNN